MQASCPVLRPDRYGFFRASEHGAPAIARGGGRCFAAASFGIGVTSVELGAFDRVLDFDTSSGEVEIEAGISLVEFSRFLASRGRVLPVQTGDPTATIGGCIACDVPGENPARDGTFIAQVRALRVFHPDHGMVVLSETAGPELFRATCGGYGLTGIVVTATLRTAAAPVEPTAERAPERRAMVTLFRRNRPVGVHAYQAILPPQRVPDWHLALRDLTARHGVAITRKAALEFAGSGDLLRFDGEGTAVAFDLPRGRTAHAFLADVDGVVMQAGGRPNIGRDSRLPRAVFEATYPDCDRFRAVRRAWDRRQRFRSDLSERLGL